MAMGFMLFFAGHDTMACSIGLCLTWFSDSAGCRSPAEELDDDDAAAAGCTEEAAGWEEVVDTELVKSSLGFLGGRPRRFLTFSPGGVAVTGG